jgi:outer membrane protein
MTQEQGQTAQAQLQQEEQSIMAFRDKAAQDLAKEDASQFAGKVKSKTEDFRKDGKAETAHAM